MVDRSLVVGVAVYGDQLVERQRPTTIADAPGGVFAPERLKLRYASVKRLANGESRMAMARRACPALRMTDRIAYSDE